MNVTKLIMNVIKLIMNVTKLIMNVTKLIMNVTKLKSIVVNLFQHCLGPTGATRINLAISIMLLSHKSVWTNVRESLKNAGSIKLNIPSRFLVILKRMSDIALGDIVLFCHKYTLSRGYKIDKQNKGHNERIPDQVGMVSFPIVVQLNVSFQMSQDLQRECNKLQPLYRKTAYLLFLESTCRYVLQQITYTMTNIPRQLYHGNYTI